jgi:hypothetical protein
VLAAEGRVVEEGVWLVVGDDVVVGKAVKGVALAESGDCDGGGGGGCEDGNKAAVVVGEAVDGVKRGAGERGLAVV